MREHYSELLFTKLYWMLVTKMKMFLKSLCKLGKMLFAGSVKASVLLLLGLLMCVILLALIISKFVLSLGNLLMSLPAQTSKEKD